MSRRRLAIIDQPSLVPLADMLTNTVGIMLFILIFVSLSAGGAVISRRLPIEHPTKKIPVWILCSGGKLVRFDPTALQRDLEKGLGEPSFSTAENWATKFSSRKVETDDVQASGAADTEYSSNFFQQSVRIKKSIAVRRKASRGDDEAAVKDRGSHFQLLLAEKDKKANFFFFFVEPDSIKLFRAARDQAVKAGFDIGWDPLGNGEPARFGSGGKEATVQ